LTVSADSDIFLTDSQEHCVALVLGQEVS